MSNPFTYGRVVQSLNFCPRPSTAKQLVGHIKARHNVVLQGERRVGKTSLIYEVSRQLKSHRLLYIDLLEVKSVDDVCKRLARAIFALEKQGNLFEKALKLLSKLRPTLSLDPVSGEPSIALDTRETSRPESLEELLDLVGVLARRKPLLVAIDEFQDILNLDQARTVLAILRSKIQFQTKIPYVFSGSIRNAMHEIFNDAASPFFKSAIAMELGPLDRQLFIRFLKQKFVRTKRSVDPLVWNELLSTVCENPGDVQQLCGALWEVTPVRQKITMAHMSDAMQLIYSREAKGYEATLVQLTAQQMKCLCTLARLPELTPYTKAFLEASGIRQPGSVKKSLQRLTQLKIIYLQEQHLRFINPFFRTWLLWKGY